MSWSVGKRLVVEKSLWSVMRTLSKTNLAFIRRLYDSIWVLGRPRTADALGKLAHTLPARVVRKIPGVRIFAPASVWGEVCRLPCNGEVLLYLSPDLERLPQRAVNYVVAHEFAHIVLGHYGPEFRYSDSWVEHHDEKPEEQAADTLVRQWGYRVDDNPIHMDPARRAREAEEEDRCIALEIEQDRQKMQREYPKMLPTDSS